MRWSGERAFDAWSRMGRRGRGRRAAPPAGRQAPEARLDLL